MNNGIEFRICPSARHKATGNVLLRKGQHQCDTCKKIKGNPRGYIPKKVEAIDETRFMTKGGHAAAKEVFNIMLAIEARTA